MNKNVRSIYSVKTSLVLILSLLSLMIIFAGYFYYLDEVNDSRTEKYNELKAITELKIDQLIQWREEKMSDILTVTQSPFFTRAVEEYIKSRSNSTLETDINNRLNLLKRLGKYESISLISPNAGVIISISSNQVHIDSIINLKIKETLKSHNIVLTDLYKCSLTKNIHYDIIAPLVNDSNITIAVIVFRINPNDYIYPLINRMPIQSKTNETLLLRQEGDKVVFLNESRHIKNTAFNMNIPLARKELPSVKAVIGYKGLYEGKDYRNVNVFAYISPIKKTQWFMITKVDKSELLNRAYFESIIIIVFSFVLILFLWFIFAYVYNKRQKNTYRELWEAQEEFKTTLYSIGDGVITTNEFGLVQHLNFLAEELTGWLESEAKGKSLQKVFKVIHEETNEVVENPVQKILKNGEVVSISNHTLLVSKDGSRIPIVNNGAPIKSADGKIMGVVLVFRNQTEEKKRQKSLRESEEKYRNLFAFTNDGISLHEIIYDEKKNPINYILLDVNKKYEEIIGLTKEEVIGKTATEVYKCEMPPYLEIYVKVALGGSPVTFETYFEPMELHFAVSVYSPGEGKFATVFQNITERKKAEREIIHAKEIAEEMNRAKTIFFANMSHELRTPFVGIMGYASLLTQMISDPEAKEMAEGILNSSKRLTNTLTKILDITKLEFEKTEILFKECSVAKIIDEICQQFSKTAEQKNLFLKKNIFPETLSVETDERLLTEIINNLVSNAIKFTDIGWIEINAEKQLCDNKELLIIKVKDSGIGISHDKHEVIWEEFRQASEGFTRSYQGTGLGLSIVKRYTELLNGKVYLESESDKGSVFIIELPILRNKPDEEDKYTLECDTLSENESEEIYRKKILYLEDETNARDFVKRTLFKKYDVYLAETAEKALNYIKENLYDAVLVNINLGVGIDGIDLTHIIKKMNKYSNIPIVAVSAHANKKYEKEIVNKGFDYYISKPFMMQDLLSLLEKILNTGKGIYSRFH